ncbi:maltodextrin phosphorylase [Prevotella sp. CAG:604]|nr:maltodextrin phosphorylase [Prevotella sp. CAG:604]
MSANDNALAKEIALWKESVAERWDGIHVVSKNDETANGTETGKKYKIQYVIDEQGLNDAVGLELVVLTDQPENGKQVYSVFPFKVIGHEGNNYTFEAEIEPVNAGSFKTAVRMFPKSDKLPHRQDFCYVKWLD